MYKYPEYNPQSVGGFMNPRDYGNTIGTTVVPTSSFPTQTFDQLGDYYNNINNVNVPSYPTTPIGIAPSTNGGYNYAGGLSTYGLGSPTGTNSAATPSIGAAFKNMLGLGGDRLTQIKDGVGSAVDTAGANAQTAWGKMSYGERGTALLGAATGLYGAYNARKTGKLAREQFNFSKDAFNRNFAAQAKTTNSQLADRQNARHTRDPKAHSSVADYMKKYGV